MPGKQFQPLSHPLATLCLHSIIIINQIPHYTPCDLYTPNTRTHAHEVNTTTAPKHRTTRNYNTLVAAAVDPSPPNGVGLSLDTPSREEGTSAHRPLFFVTAMRGSLGASSSKKKSGSGSCSSGSGSNPVAARAPLAKKKGGKRGAPQTFASKLFNVLQAAEGKKGSPVSWCLEGARQTDLFLCE